MQTANSHPSNRPIPFFATKTPGTDFSFTLNLNSFCQSCLAPNLQLFTAKPQHPGCSQSESWDGPHQPPYEHPKSVINNKNLGSCDRDQTKLPTVVFFDFWVSMVFFFRLSTPHLCPQRNLPTEFLGSKGNKLSKSVRRASTVDQADRWRPGQNQMSYWWWLKILRSPVEEMVVSPIICKVLAPSQVVVWEFFHQQ